MWKDMVVGKYDGAMGRGIEMLMLVDLVGLSK